MRAFEFGGESGRTTRSGGFRNKINALARGKPSFRMKNYGSLIVSQRAACTLSPARSLIHPSRKGITRMAIQNVKTADMVMSGITIVLALPLGIVPFAKPTPEVTDVLTYFSFFLSVLSALYVGRGVFSIGGGTDEDSSKNQESHARSSFIVSVLWLFGAALMLMPVLFKKTNGVLPWVGIVFVVACLIAGAVCIRVDHKKEGWRSPHLFMPILPFVLLIFVIIAVSWRYASELSRFSI